jgi:hypothetical protein
MTIGDHRYLDLGRDRIFTCSLVSMKQEDKRGYFIWTRLQHAISLFGCWLEVPKNDSMASIFHLY